MRLSPSKEIVAERKQVEPDQVSTRAVAKHPTGALPTTSEMGIVARFEPVRGLCASFTTADSAISLSQLALNFGRFPKIYLAKEIFILNGNSTHV
jgi:hypothetical protein